ncbi:hypothetical protein QZH41_012235 [Actinostola sp. cb2023]|nr:hypothetical protein QZH41_012235 [Actinostola sp. cb2023]
MFNTTNNSVTTNSTKELSGIIDGGSTMRTFFGLVAGLSVVSNALLCIVMLRRRAMLSKTYNILIFNLAITDMLTGVFLFITPRYVVSQESFPLLYGASGEAFCRIVWSTYLLFCFGKASNGTIMCLAIDRWYSIVKPIKYKIAFGRRRLFGYIVLIWVTSAVTESLGFFITKLQNGRCMWDAPPYSENGQRMFLLVHVFVTFYIPSTVTWITFAHIWYRLSHVKVNAHHRDVRAKKRLVRMCAMAAFFLTLCWFPTETFWVLFKFDVLKLPQIWYWLFNLFAMFNSCVSPWVYCLSNKQYRNEFGNVLCRLKPREIRPAGTAQYPTVSKARKGLSSNDSG